MRILYITSAICKDDFPELCKIWNVSLNSSNQNFHHKVISSLSISHNVDVISVRPFNSSCSVPYLDYKEKTEGNITWHYLEMDGDKKPSLFKKSEAVIGKNNFDIIICDTINVSILNLALQIKQKIKKPCIGLITDSPYNITGVNFLYRCFDLFYGRKLDGYISLTSELNNLYNKNDKPYIVIEGLTIIPENENKTEPYFFFGGALLPKYGVYSLINAFKKVNNGNISLYICGHHGDKEMIEKAISDDKRIKYLGLLPLDEVLKYESTALANINPRPQNEEIDKYSIPSKTIEYLASGQVTISVHNDKLLKYYGDTLIWTNSGDENDLLNALNKVINMTEEERKVMGASAKAISEKEFSLLSFNKKVSNFLSKFTK